MSMIRCILSNHRTKADSPLQKKSSEHEQPHLSSAVDMATSSPATSVFTDRMNAHCTPELDLESQLDIATAKLRYIFDQARQGCRDQPDRISHLEEQLQSARQTLAAADQQIQAMVETYNMLQVSREWLAERPITKVRVYGELADKLISQCGDLLKLPKEESADKVPDKPLSSHVNRDVQCCCLIPSL
ncbi:hypothetical protein VTO42DRAFT_8413 [Malbranchea cinnamomea]